MRRKLIKTLAVTIAVAFIPHSAVKAEKFPLDYQNYHAREIAREVSEHWEEYGVLPSVAVAQAFLESQLGKTTDSYNMWGICRNEVKYYSLEEGVHGYMGVINNGYYPNAPFVEDYHTQIYYILEGGYCPGTEEKYYNDIVWIINNYDLQRYDCRMFSMLNKKAEKEKRLVLKKKKNRERRKEWNKYFHVVYNSEVPPDSVMVDSSLIKKGAVVLYENDEMQGVFDVVKGGTKGRFIQTSDLTLVGKKVKLKVYEEARG